ncbi:MAG: SIS domain-containing protein, partial [Ignavibacteria bacterium]|nr:SIS domain-containing protein [Ignavibacteria bacterium]
MSNYFNKIKESIEDSISTKEKLFKESASKIEELAKKLALVIKNGGKILVCGNGGSAADSQHFAAELVIRYRSSFPRPAIPAIALTVDSSILSAGGNDIGFENVFARQVEALGQKGDALLGISTSGNSENVLRAIEQANKIGLLSFGLL